MDWENSEGSSGSSGSASSSLKSTVTSSQLKKLTEEVLELPPKLIALLQAWGPLTSLARTWRSFGNDFEELKNFLHLLAFRSSFQLSLSFWVGVTRSLKLPYLKIVARKSIDCACLFNVYAILNCYPFGDPADAWSKITPALYTC